MERSRKTYPRRIVTYENLVTFDRFPSIGLGNGMATLDFKSEKQAANRILDFKFDLKGADQKAFISAFSKAKPFTAKPDNLSTSTSLLPLIPRVKSTCVFKPKALSRFFAIHGNRACSSY